jgi:hypothetical protein
MEHIENHLHAFLKDGVVQNVVNFSEHNQALVDLICSEQGFDTAVSCCAFGIAGIGDTFTGTYFKPTSPTPTAVWDEELKMWIPPIPKPSEGNWWWDEPNQTWVEFTPPEETE